MVRGLGTSIPAINGSLSIGTADTSLLMGRVLGTFVLLSAALPTGMDVVRSHRSALRRWCVRMALEASWNGERHCSLMRGLQSRHYDLMRSMRGCWFSNRQASVEPVVRLKSETDFPVELETVLAEPAPLALITSDTSSSASAVPAL